MAYFPVMGVPITGEIGSMPDSSALVPLMTPGLAFFSGGTVRSNSVAVMLKMSRRRVEHGSQGGMK